MITQSFENLLTNTNPNTINPSLDRINKFLDILGNPHKKLNNSVIIAGTNGKATTCYSLYFLLRKNGIKTGLFTSPHIFDVKERIIVDDNKITEQDSVRLFNMFNKYNEFIELTYFEKLTVIAICYFIEKKVDIAIFEAGLGGRWDSVKVIPADTVIIPGVSIDHTKYLGEHRKNIIYDKFHITENRKDAILGFRIEGKNHSETIRSKKVYQYGKNFNWYESEFIYHDNILKIKYPDKFPFYMKPGIAAGLFYFLKKYNKKVNDIDFIDIPFRFQKITENIIIDNAHNPESIFYTVNELLKRYSGDIYILLGICKDKDIDSILSIFTDKRIKILVYETSIEGRILKSKDLIKKLDKKRIMYYFSMKGYTDIIDNLSDEDCFCAMGSAGTISRFCREYNFNLKLFWGG